MNQPQGVPGDFPDEFFEGAVVEGPFFDFGDQVHGNIDGPGFFLLFEGQMPARLGTTRSVKLAQRAFQKGADLSDAAEGGGAEGSVAIFGGAIALHVATYTYLLF